MVRVRGIFSAEFMIGVRVRIRVRILFEVRLWG